MKIAVSQIQVVECSEDRGNTQRLNTVLETIARAADEADVVCFPEYFLGKSPPEPMPNAALLAIQDSARLAGINVICGVTRELRHGDGSYLTSIVINRAGCVIASLDKTSLYPAEQIWYRAGRGELLVELDAGIGIGVLAGFDLLRSDLVRTVVQAGAQLFIAQFAADSPAYLETLRAVITTRALEHLAPVVAVGQLGKFFGREYIGGSTVVQPTLTAGNLPGPVERVLAMGDEEAMWVVDLDLDAFREMRRRLSYFGPPRIPQR
jgi:predicted amidohydrolase